MHNIAENNLNSTISEVDLCIFVIHVLSEFQLKMSMNDRDNEWQPEIYYLNFLSPREITLQKII